MDVTSAGHQPMISRCGRYIIVFNGEIYNHAQLREELGSNGYIFRGHSDTEVLLASVAEWGIETALIRLVGMFAIGLWDRTERSLCLARDRLGEKPLYYCKTRSGMAFGSELKALAVAPGWEGEIDPRAAGLFLRFGYIPSPFCIYKGVSKLPTGSWLRIQFDQAGEVHNLVPSRYWDLRTVIATAGENPFRGTDAEAICELDRLLNQAIQGQMLADVPVGAFLSGGIDSSTIVAIMQRHASKPVRTFTIGFADQKFDEARYSSRVAEHLGADHTELMVGKADIQSIVPKLPLIYDEPFGDSSQIPTFLVSALARRSVTVSLSGDGGDELFCGYNSYFRAGRLWPRLALAPVSMRRRVAALLGKFAAGSVGQRPGGWLDLLRNRSGRAAEIVAEGSREQFFKAAMSQWRNTEAIVTGGTPVSTVYDECAVGLQSYWDWMMQADTRCYLPDDILVKVDRAAMAASLETRVPMLDHRIVEFAWRLPFRFKVRDGVGKWILRQILYKHVPAEMVDRPKMGFSVPLDKWLRTDLRDWAEALLSEQALQAAGIINVHVVRREWEAFLSGSRIPPGRIWNVLMFQAWLECYHRHSKWTSSAPSLSP